MALIAELGERLEALVRARSGRSDACVVDVTPLPGHSGLTYSFEVHYRSGGQAAAEKQVLRLAPPGVPASGPNDVVRLGKIMESMAQRGIPVPPVRWYDDDARWFGTAFCVVGFMPGERLVLGPRSFGPGEVRGLAPQAIGAMALLHSLEWRELAGVWGAPVSLRAELERLSGLLKRPRLEPEIAVLARRLGEQITARVPQEEDFRCVHGDFQWSNLLFDSGRLSAVLDWELTHLGQAPVDLGWLMLFSDVESWDGSDLVPQGAPGPRDLLELYNAHQERPRAFEELCWFRAFAAYRFAVITAFNLMLHRAGKRPDAKWEEIALSMPRLIRRAERLLRPAAS